MSTPDNPFEQIIIPTGLPSAWPPAPIYWLLALLVIVAIGLSVYFIKRHINQQKVIKQALASLQALQQTSPSFAQLNQLLKGLSLQFYPRAQVASLTGEDWFAFIQQHHYIQKNNSINKHTDVDKYTSDQSLFNNKEEFCQRLYQTPSTCEQKDFDAAKQWIQSFPKQFFALQKSTANHQAAGINNV